MKFDTGLEAQRTSFKTVDLQRLIVAAQSSLDPAIIHGLSFSERVYVECFDRLVWQLKGYVWAESPKEISVSFPSDWWEHFKLRWFPKRALKRWPVKYTTRRMEGQLFYPSLPQTTPEHVYRLRMAVWDGPNAFSGADSVSGS